MNSLERLGRRLSSILLTVATLMLVCIVAINAVNVTGRYVFASAIGWSEEVMQFLMIACVFFAFVEVTIDQEHIRMDVMVRLLPRPFRRLFSVLGNSILVGSCALIVAAGLPVIFKLYQFGQTSDAAEIPVFIPQLAVPIGFGISALLLLFKLRHWGDAFEACEETPNHAQK